MPSRTMPQHVVLLVLAVLLLLLTSSSSSAASPPSSTGKCILDASAPLPASSSSSSRLPDGAVVGQARFLVFHPQGGLTNQLLALRVATIYARTLRRKLIVPPIMNHPPRDGWQDVDSVLNPEAMFDQVGDVRWALWANVRRTVPAPGRLVVWREATDAVRATRHLTLWPASWKVDSLPEVQVDGEPLDVDAIVQAYGGCEDVTLAFVNMFQWDAPAFVKSDAALATRVRRAIPTWSDKIRHFAAGLTERMSPLLCVHMRHGDFEEYCRKRAEHAEPWFSMDKCLPDVHDVAERLIAADVLSPSVKTVYIATNHPRPASLVGAFLHEMADEVQGPVVVTYDTVSGARARFTMEQRAALVAELCTKADYFVGNEFSTLSQLIMSRRNDIGRDSLKAGVGVMEPSHAVAGGGWGILSVVGVLVIVAIVAGVAGLIPLPSLPAGRRAKQRLH